jgi:hypothetical protein
MTTQVTGRPIDVLDRLAATRADCVRALRLVDSRGPGEAALKAAIDLLDSKIAAVVAGMGEGSSHERGD